MGELVWLQVARRQVVTARKALIGALADGDPNKIMVASRRLAEALHKVLRMTNSPDPPGQARDAVCDLIRNHPSPQRDLALLLALYEMAGMVPPSLNGSTQQRNGSR